MTEAARPSAHSRARPHRGLAGRLCAIALLVASGPAPALARADSLLTPPNPGGSLTQGSIMGPALRSTDLDRSIRFYTRGLGLNFAGRLDLPMAVELMFTFGPEKRPPVLIIFQRKDSSAKLAVDEGNSEARTVLQVADADAVARRLHAAGYAPFAMHVSPDMKSTAFNVKDPDGHEFEIVQRP